MKAQSRKGSALESILNIGVGMVVAFLIQLIIFPMFGFHPTLGQNFGILAIFTVASFVRQYAMRRIFNFMQERSNATN